LPYFTIQVSPQGPIIDAFIGVSEAKRLALESAGQPVPPLHQIRALIDTGASCTCLDPSVIMALALTPTGNTAMNTPTTGNQPKTCNTYDVSLFIPNGNFVPFALQTIEIAEIDQIAHQGYAGLIGRDVLSTCHLTYDGRSGLFTFAY
jgi:predicted aspartyl protease